MPTYDFTPDSTFMLTTDEQIRAYINPTRMTILTWLAQEKQSVSGVARRLGVHPANLTHHFKLLEKVGLIRLVEKRDTGKNLEKLYRAVAYAFSVALDRTTADPRLTTLAILRDNLTSAVNTLPGFPAEQPVLGVLKAVRIKPEDLEAFQKKLLALADEFVAQQSATGEVYSFNASLYPTRSGNLPARQVTFQVED